jgi:hypothetical protein
MRQIYLILAQCMAVLLLGIALLFTYDRAGYDVTLPGAANVRTDGNAIARRQQITYRLPPNRTINDLYVQLEQAGWSRDRRAEQRLQRDQMEYDAVLGAFTRQHLFGALSEIALISISSTDRQTVRIELFRCLRFFSPSECF